MISARSVAGAMALATLGMAATASAAQISGPFSSTQVNSLKTDWSGQSLSFPQFDSHLGVLQSVEIQLNGSLSTTLTVTNLAPSSSSGTVRTELGIVLQDSGNNLNGVLSFIDGPTIDMLSPTQGYSLGAGQSATLATRTQTGSSDDTYTSPVVLQEFTGPGTITLPASSITQTVLSNSGGNTTASQVTYASRSGNVIYTYTIPEPAVLGAVAMSGALALGIRRRAKLQ